MFVIYDKEKQRVPIKVWLGHKSQLEESCLKQAMNLANHPSVFHHVALMSDTHMGYGMPIGGVMACNDSIIPNAVGVDIGCGVRFCLTDIPWNEIKESTTGDGQEIRKAILGNIMRNIPVGFNKHKKPQNWDGFDTPQIKYDVIKEHIDNATHQLGTLGGGR